MPSENENVDISMIFKFILKLNFLENRSTCELLSYNLQYPNLY